MVKHRYECWRTSDSTDLTFATAENIVELKRQELISQDAFLEYYIEADTWEEACSVHYLRQGWEEFKSMSE